MARKGGSGIKVIIVLIIIFGLIIFGVYKVTQSKLFDDSNKYLLEDAARVSTVEFEKEAKRYNYKDMIENPESFKDKKMVYIGKIENIEENKMTGTSEVEIKVTLSEDDLKELGSEKEKYPHTNSGSYYYGKIRMHIPKDLTLKYYIGDRVMAYGTFNKVDLKSEDYPVMELEAVAIKAYVDKTKTSN